MLHHLQFLFFYYHVAGNFCWWKFYGAPTQAFRRILNFEPVLHYKLN